MLRLPLPPPCPPRLAVLCGLLAASGLRPHPAQARSAAPAVPVVTIPVPPPPPPSSGDPKFDDFLAQAKTEALASGITPATFDSATAGIAPLPAIIAMNANQPEFTKPVWSYLDAAVSARRIKDAQFMLARYGEVLDRIAAQYRRAQRNSGRPLGHGKRFRRRQRQLQPVRGPGDAGL